MHLLSYCWLLKKSDDKIKPNSVNCAIDYFMKNITLQELDKMLENFLKIFELCKSYYEEIFYAIYYDKEGNIQDKHKKIYYPFAESIMIFLYKKMCSEPINLKEETFKLIKKFKEEIFKDYFYNEEKKYSCFFSSTQSYANVKNRIDIINSFFSK